MKFSNTAYRKSPLERGAQAQRWRSQRPINNAPATLLSILVTWLLLAPRSKCLPSVSTSKSKCLSFLPRRGISRGGSKSWEGAVGGDWEQLIILKILVHETRYMWLVGLTDNREGFLASIRINSTRINLLYIVTFCGNIAYFVLVICFSPLSIQSVTKCERVYK